LASDDESEGEDLSDDDFEGARETHYEDPEMEEEADLAAQEAAEELKRQRIEGESIRARICVSRASDTDCSRFVSITPSSSVHQSSV
jgi:hypothetical protein